MLLTAVFTTKILNSFSLKISFSNYPFSLPYNSHDINSKLIFYFILITCHLCDWYCRYKKVSLRARHSRQINWLWGWLCPLGLIILRKVSLIEKFSSKTLACLRKPVALLLKMLMKPLTDIVTRNSVFSKSLMGVKLCISISNDEIKRV